MTIDWTDVNTSRWFEDAAAYSPYNESIAEILLKSISVRGSLCDMGCGMGLVDFALAPYFDAITCMDISPTAVQAVQAGAEKRSISNITAVVGDSRTAGGQWDNVISLFHGSPEDFAGPFMRLARHTLIAVTHGRREATFGPKAYKIQKCSDPESYAAGLDSLGIKYTMQQHVLEYGQPLRSKQDALAFAAQYSKNPPGSILEDYLAKSLVETGRDDFPYYLPNEKKFAVFVIQKDENA